MGLEAATYVGDLVATNPLTSDAKSQGDDHLRLIKAALQATFPGMAGAFGRVQAKSSGYTVVANDNTTIFNCTAALTLSLTAAATLGNKHMFFVFANGGAVVLDPNSTEQINGATTITITNGSWAVVFCNGTSFLAMSPANAGVNADITGLSALGAGTAALPSVTPSGDPNTGWWFPAGDTMAWSTGGSERMRIDPSGNIGFGVTPTSWANFRPLELFAAGNHIAGTASGSMQFGSGYYYNAGDKYAVTGNYAMYSSAVASDGSFRWYSTAATGTAGNAATLVERMRIDAAGKVGINNASGTRQLNIKHTADSGDVVAIFEDTAATATNQYGVDIRLAGDPNNTSNYFLNCLGNATQRVALRSNGGLANFSANDVNLSDERLKKDFQPAPSYYSRWKNIEFVTYLYKDQTDTYRNLGLKAGQLQQVAPELVDADGFGPTQRQATRKVSRTVESIQIIDGKAVKAVTTVEENEPLYNVYPLFEADGVTPVLRVVTPEVVDEEGNVVTPAVLEQDTYREPVMEDDPNFAPDGVPIKTVYQTDFQYATAVALQEAIAEIEALKLRVAALGG